MRHLLALAQPIAFQLGTTPLKDDHMEVKDGWKCRVHAMNVLRLVFIDATLADDIGQHVSEVR